jgi:anthranilate/para-aminobenzoate synthase component I
MIPRVSGSGISAAHGHLDAHAALHAAEGPCALLESTSGRGPLAQLSLLARRPRAWVIAGRRWARLCDLNGERRVGCDPLVFLRSLLQELPDGQWPEEAAVVGALAYDWARPASTADDAILLVALLVDRLEVFAAQPLPAASGPLVAEPSIDLERHSSLSHAEYLRLVRRVQEHIAAGDVYQANLSQRFELPLAGSGLALYDELRAVSPAPFSGYLRLPNLEIVSASPERLLSVCGREVSTRPVAGTRPRSRDLERDRALASDLLISEKERAEHLMLVDLARNDLGQVAQIGSVEVDELMSVEHYAQVRHIVSNVRARLAPECDALDALVALFPGGTITGVPKHRCLQLLDALEPVRRGFYTGSLFYLTKSGRLDANILIRSATVADGRVTFHAGGGIVADSDPELEYQETLHKASGMRLALERVRARQALAALDRIQE